MLISPAIYGFCFVGFIYRRNMPPTQDNLVRNLWRSMLGAMERLPVADPPFLHDCEGKTTRTPQQSI
ncbi:hypothetical protein OAL19_00125 [bacterium]|nr:hypothetical protein [bacterium]